MNFSVFYFYIDKSITVDNVYYYKIMESDFTGQLRESNTYAISTNYTTTQDEEKPTFKLYPNYPNPFNQTTIIRFDIEKAGKVVLRIYNIAGSHIITIINENLKPGNYSCSWDGTDWQTNSVSSGIYFYEFKIDNKRKMCKMLQLQ